MFVIFFFFTALKEFDNNFNPDNPTYWVQGIFYPSLRINVDIYLLLTNHSELIIIKV